TETVAAIQIGSDCCELELLSVLGHESPKGWIGVQLLGGSPGTAQLLNPVHTCGSGLAREAGDAVTR
ncbi:hypothetical protein ACNPOJ_05415, partial [Pseudomonas vlassakiae]